MSQLRMIANYCVSGETTGQIVVGVNQIVSVGSSAIADFRIADQQLQPVHFQLQLTSRQALLAAAHGNGLIQINGMEVTEASGQPLGNGDLIHAGATEFKIVIQGESPAASAPGPISFDWGSDVVDRAVSPSPPNPDRCPPHQPPLKKSKTTIRQAVEAVGDNEHFLQLTNPTCTPESASEAIETLVSLGNYFFVVDFLRIGQPVPATVLSEKTRLFDWFPAKMADQSPQLLTCQQLPGWREMVTESWGCDGLMGLQSDLSPEELIALLRGFVRPKRSADQSVTGYCWPSVLGQVLSNNTDGFAQKMLEKVNHVFFETPAGEGWQLFAAKGCEHQLERLGFRVAQPV